MKDISRRGFFMGAAVAGGAVALTGLTGCESPQANNAEIVDEVKESHIPASIAETLEVDIVIIGAGISGLAATVQAAENGLSAITIESQGVAGGNGSGVEGTFGIDTPYQQEQGITVDPADVAKFELSGAQWRSDGLAWLDFINNSKENFTWMLDAGVKFSGQVDNYGAGLFETMHWFEGPAGEAYVPAMQSKAESLGASIMFNTTASSLIMDEGKVSGVYALNSNKEDIQINAKVVVLATGGFGSNVDLISELGYKKEKVFPVGTPGHDGVGYEMAMSAGGVSTIREEGSCLAHNLIRALPHTSCFEPLLEVGFEPTFVWLNQDGLRFVPEDFALSNVEIMTVPIKNQDKAFMIFDEVLLEGFLEKAHIDRADFDDALQQNYGDSLYSANTLEELAAFFDLDSKALKDSIVEYNDMCFAGKDTVLGKDASHLIPLQNPPFYIGRTDDVLFVVSIGGIATNRNYAVTDSNEQEIPGLYAVGVDGTMLYKNIYTINIPGTCSGDSINSARVAVNHASEYLLRA